MRPGTLAAALVLSVISVAAVTPAAPERDVPPDLAPFSPMIGAWKGMGIPVANRLKGWPERHLWAWKFVDGQASGLSFTIEGGKVVTRGQLSFDPAIKRYRLEGQDADGKPVVFAGPADSTGRALTLDRVGSDSAGKERLTIRLNSNQIRYTMWLDRQDPGAAQFHRVIEMNLGKEGEQFAAGGSATDLPKCIITGGAAALSVSFEGKSYPICCTGCRDEFLDSPAKYVQKAALRAQAAAKAKPASAVTSNVGKDDGAFDGLVEEPNPAKPAAQPKAAPKAESKAESTEPPAAAKPGAVPDPAARAASLLRSAQALEKLGKTAPALESYRQIVAKYPGTSQAKTAAERIKALEPK